MCVVTRILLRMLITRLTLMDFIQLAIFSYARADNKYRHLCESLTEYLDLKKTLNLANHESNGVC